VTFLLNSWGFHIIMQSYIPAKILYTYLQHRNKQKMGGGGGVYRGCGEV